KVDTRRVAREQALARDHQPEGRATTGRVGKRPRVLRVGRQPLWRDDDPGLPDRRRDGLPPPTGVPRMSVFPGASATRDFGELRKLPLIIALALILICVALELGAAGFLHTAGNTAEAVQNVQQSKVFRDMTPAQQQRTIQSVQNAAGQDDPPGLGIPYLPLVDGILA